LRAFSFSSFPLFAEVRAKSPFDRHQNYELVGGHIEPLAARPPPPELTSWVAAQGTFRRMWRDRAPAQLARDLRVILDDTRAAFPRRRHHRRAAVAVGVPGRTLPPSPRGSIGSTSRSSASSAATARCAPRSARWPATGSPCARRAAAWSSPTARWRSWWDDVPSLHPLAATATATGWTLAEPLAGDPVYLVAQPPGEAAPWLVAGRTYRGY
jgi:hypothetical protein